MADQLFLSLDDAVLVARAEFGINPELARQEFEQKCYISDDQYSIGYCDALEAIINNCKCLLGGDK